MENEELLDPATQGEGSGTSIEKFKTPEERDKAYVELEKLTYSQTQRLAEMERKMEVLAAQAQPAQENRQFTDLYPAQNAQPEMDRREAELASRLLTKPSEVLQQHAAWVRAESRKEFAQDLANQRAVDRFQMEFPELVKHEELVTVFVQKQPTNLSPTERLRKAASETRKYLAGIQGTNSETKLDPDTFVESPSTSAGSATQRVAKEPTPDDELAEMIHMRNTIQAKKRL